jgi:perosamine synthetase
VGTFGRIGCFSLQQAKHITCGDGGLAVTDDPKLARRMRLFSDKGWPRDEPGRSYQLLGRNYRMTELQAAVARVQLGRLPQVIASRRATAGGLCERLGELEWLHLPDPVGHSFWMFPLVLQRAVPGENHRFQDRLLARDVPAVAGYLPEPLYANAVLSRGPPALTHHISLRQPNH